MVARNRIAHLMDVEPAARSYRQARSQGWLEGYEFAMKERSRQLIYAGAVCLVVGFVVGLFV